MNHEKQFVKGLKYELMFRKLSQQVFTELQASSCGGMRSESIGLLLRIEQQNSVVMQSVRNDFDIDTTISFADRVLAKIVIFLLTLMPSVGMRYMEGSASRFVAQLEDIARLSPKNYKEQMCYMVAHEKALYDFLVEYNQGNLNKADAIFEAFIAQYQVR